MNGYWHQAVYVAKRYILLQKCVTDECSPYRGTILQLSTLYTAFITKLSTPKI